MSRVTVGKWGKNLAIRVPFEIAETSGLSEGEEVEIEAKDGDLLIRRPLAHARTGAQKAAQDLLRGRKGRSLGGLSIRNLINEGRR
ncbi:MAG: AbrB/MazE/SpoVT family DNA-binding domain-containing protein [Rhodospirillaceae bacterium]|nr:MAG: AbrB/MazE/SpoVT family DNA-binding domain-containing protein [Rhodospirillaceae bacterium]